MDLHFISVGMHSPRVGLCLNVFVLHDKLSKFLCLGTLIYTSLG